MKMTIPYEIRNIHTSDRYPGIVYAQVWDMTNSLCAVSATLKYCVEWVERAAKHDATVSRAKEMTTENKVDPRNEWAKAFARDKAAGGFYVDQEGEDWGVFGTESGFCYGLHASKCDAEAQLLGMRY